MSLQRFKRRISIVHHKLYDSVCNRHLTKALGIAGNIWNPQIALFRMYHRLSGKYSNLYFVKSNCSGATLLRSFTEEENHDEEP
jgi:hypothetical protein